MAFRGNPRLRGHREQYEYSEEHLKEYLKCRADFEYWVEKYAKIATLDEGIITIKLRKYQQRMVRTIKNLPKMGKRGMVVLAPRQCGKTTGIYLYILWLVIFFNHKRVAIIANKGANARKVIRDIKQAYEFLPIWMQPGIKDGGWSKGTVELENGSIIIAGSTTSDSVRGSTFHCLSGDSVVIVKASDGTVYRTTMRGLNEYDESTFVELNNVYLDDGTSISIEQVHNHILRDNGEGVELSINGTTSCDSAMPWWYGRICQSETIEHEGSFGGTPSIDQDDHGCRIDETTIRLCTDGIGSPRKIPQNELVGTKGGDSSISGCSIETHEGNQLDSRTPQEDRGCASGDDTQRGTYCEDAGIEERKSERDSEVIGTSQENIRIEQGTNKSTQSHNQQESRKDSEDGRETQGNEAFGSVEATNERTAEGEAITSQGNEGVYIGRDPNKDAGIGKTPCRPIGWVRGEHFEVLTRNGWQSFDGCVNNGTRETVSLNLKNGMTIRVTLDHKVDTNNGWLEAGDLLSNDMVKTTDGQSEFDSLTDLQTETVYDLINVNGGNHFYSNGMVVHNCVYMDEIAFIPRHASDDFMKSILPTILSGKSAQLFATSTPKGMNHFWKMWRKAESGLGLFVPVKIDYTEVPAYCDPAFKKMIIETEGIQTWLQEFACKFLGSSKTLICAESLENMTLTLLPEPILMHFNDKFKVWERPRVGCTYIVSADVGKGVGGDYSVAQVLRIDGMHKCEQVAIFADNYTPIDDFGQICVSIARYYNQSEIIVENNDLGGILCERIFENFNYDRLVSYEKNYYGVRSNKKSKAIGNIAVREYVENGWVKINDEKTVSEFSFYEELRDGVFGAISGEHDDRVMSLMWALYFIKSNSEFEDEGVNQINPRFRINDAESGYEDTGMGDGDADWLGGGGSTGGSADWLGGFGDDLVTRPVTMFGKEFNRESNLFSGFGDDSSDMNIFGSVKAGANSKVPQLAHAGGGGFKHPTGATSFDDDLPMM